MIHDVTVISANVWDCPWFGECDGAISGGEKLAKVVEPGVACARDRGERGEDGGRKAR